MSASYITALVIVLAQVLSLFGIEADAPAVETPVNTIVLIVSAIIIAYRRWAKGDIGLGGLKEA